MNFAIAKHWEMFTFKKHTIGTLMCHYFFCHISNHSLPSSPSIQLFSMQVSDWIMTSHYDKGEFLARFEESSQNARMWLDGLVYRKMFLIGNINHIVKYSDI